jgi:hypothetical protein
MWARARGIGTISTNAMGSMDRRPMIFVGILNACVGLVALQGVSVFMRKSFKVVMS